MYSATSTALPPLVYPPHPRRKFDFPPLVDAVHHLGGNPGHTVGQRLVPDCPSFREGTQIPKSYTIGQHTLSLPSSSSERKIGFRSPAARGRFMPKFPPISGMICQTSEILGIHGSSECGFRISWHAPHRRTFLTDPSLQMDKVRLGRIYPMKTDEFVINSPNKCNNV